MTTRAQLRKTALAFEAVDEDHTDGVLTYSVRGNEFASLTTDSTLRLRLPAAEIDSAVAAYPTAERLLHAGRPIAFQAPLADVDGQHLWALVMNAWKHRAPGRLAAKYAEIVESPVRPGSDLPAGIGRVATRELAAAGMTTLDQVATRRKADLLAIHGVGPKAVRILADALAERGKSLTDDG